MRMVAIPRYKINYHKGYKYANVIIFKEFYPEKKNVKRQNATSPEMQMTSVMGLHSNVKSKAT